MWCFVCQEEVVNLRKKVERAKKIEMASSADEVLQEEIREYKVSGQFVYVVSGQFVYVVSGQFVYVVSGQFVYVVSGQFVYVVSGQFVYVVSGQFVYVWVVSLSM